MFFLKAKSIKHKAKIKTQKCFAFLRTCHLSSVSAVGFAETSPVTCHPSREARGNFMLQALLAISLVIAFMPMLARKMSGRQHDAQMAASAAQIESAATAAREFIRDNSDNLSYGVRTYDSDKMVDLLEPYGLPLGFMPRTPLGQKISITITKNETETIAFIVTGGGKLRPIDRAELAMRIGFWAAETTDGGKTLIGATGGWTLNSAEFGIKPKEDAIWVRVPANTEFSELLSRKSKKIEDNKFHTNLLMGGRSIRNVRDIFAREGGFKSVLAGDFVLSGIDDGRKMKNKFGKIDARRATFGSAHGDALNITKGDLIAKYLSATSISEYGDVGNLESDFISVHEFSMAAGRSGFAGPAKWEIRGNAILENVTMTVERMEISGFINATRGQDVFIESDTFTHSLKSGIETGTVAATNLTLRDQTSAALLGGGTGPAILDIRPAGVSVLPDALVEGINNDAILIPISADDNYGNMQSCKAVIESLSGMHAKYDSRSLSQNIVCRYVFLQRLEQRIDLKKCLMEGKSKC